MQDGEAVVVKFVTYHLETCSYMAPHSHLASNYLMHVLGGLESRSPFLSLHLKSDQGISFGNARAKIEPLTTYMFRVTL